MNWFWILLALSAFGILVAYGLSSSFRQNFLLIVAKGDAGERFAKVLLPIGLALVAGLGLRFAVSNKNPTSPGPLSGDNGAKQTNALRGPVSYDPIDRPTNRVGEELKPALSSPHRDSSEKALPQPAYFPFTGRIASVEGHSITGATVRVGGHRAERTANDGTFELRLPRRPSGDQFVQVSHNDYLVRFLRSDDPIFSTTNAIQLEQKWRLIVSDFDGTTQAPFHRSRDEMRSAIEGCLGACRDEITVLAVKEKPPILEELYRYQREHAKYNPETLVKIGEFYAATHGVFGSAKSVDTNIQIEAKLINLKTTKIEASGSVLDVQINEACKAVSDQLLAQLARIEILSPQDEAQTGQKLTVRGYRSFFPRSWKLWMSVLPLGNDREYPQSEISVVDDTEWTASVVHVGPPEPVQTPKKFEIHALISGGQLSMVISNYVAHQRSDGLSPGSWPNGYHRIPTKIEVIRLDQE